MIRPHLLTIVLFLVGAPGSAGAERYTLKALVDKVLREAPSVVAARSFVATRRAQLLEQQLRWLPEGETWFRAAGAPQVLCSDATGGFASTARERLNDCRQTSVVDLQRSAPGFTIADRAPFAGPSLFWFAQLRQPLFTSLKIESAVGSARGGVGTSEADLRTAELEIGVNAVRIFTQIKLARATLATLDTAIGVIGNFAAHIERELDGKNTGRYVVSDQVRMTLLSNSMKGQVVDQNRNLHAALEALRALTADPEADVDESDLEWVDRPVEQPAVWRERMLESRPEMQYARAGMKYYRAWRRLQLGWALPDVALITNVGWGYSPTFEYPNVGFASLPGAPTAAFGFAAREPLDLAQKLNHYFQVGHEREMQESRFKLGVAWWTVEVDKAWLDLDEARRRLRENQRGHRLTQGWYATVEANLALGLAPDGRELVEVILNWSGFRTRTVQATADAMVAAATLHRLSGQPILDGESP